MKPGAHPDSLFKISHLIHRILVHALPSLYFLITVSFFLRTYDSAQIKITFFQVGSTMLLTLWLVKISVEGRFPFEKRDWVFAAPFIALLVSGLASYLHSPFKAMAFDETTRRIFYMALALIILSEFRTEESTRRLLRWIVASAVITIVYGLVQYLDIRLFVGEQTGIDPFVWRGAFGTRIFSSFGNPNFFGNFLVLITPILIAQYLKHGGPVGRPFIVWGLTAALVWLTDSLTIHYSPGNHFMLYERIGLCAIGPLLAVATFKKTGSSAIASLMLIVLGMLLINLYATETKGAWLGFTVAVVVTMTIITRYFVKGELAYIKKLLVGIMLIVVLSSSALLSYFLPRRMQSVNFRVFTWIATWEMIHTHPCLGSGIGSFKIAYPAYRRPQIIALESKSNTETDHSEDEYLEVWNDEGLVGFGIYLWFLITVLLSGFSTLKALCYRRGENFQKASHLEIGAGHPHAYDLLGYLGALCGVLMHWFVDVSIRFVSSGVYFALLPAMVVRLSDGVALEDPQENRALERKIRLGIALFWFLMLTIFQIQPLYGAIFCFLLWCLSEMFERGLWSVPSPPAPVPNGANGASEPMRAWRILAIGIVLAGGLRAAAFFRGFFLADLHHNVAIFFSKSSIWTKSPEFDAKLPSLPPELQDEYKNVGAALEQYAEVMRLNPFFPMAPYFMGNVYNDWGSQVENAAQSARNRGDSMAAETLRSTARKLWEKALQGYEAAKALAPNYVQSHHQIGLVYAKLGDQAVTWGFPQEAEHYYQIAIKNFELYRELDPIYLDNYSHLAILYLRKKDYDSVIHLYEKAFHVYETATHRNFHDREAEILTSLGKAHYLKAANKYLGKPGPANDEDVKKAEEYFLKATQTDPERPEAYKGLALLYPRIGKPALARPYWERLRQLAPQDPDVQAVFRAPSH